MAGVGYTVFATNICNWLLNNLDRTLLGRFLNVQTVGLYTVGYNLANTPNALFIGALQPAFLAAGARIQSEPGRLRSTYLSVLASVWILILPMFVLHNHYREVRNGCLNFFAFMPHDDINWA